MNTAKSTLVLILTMLLGVGGCDEGAVQNHEPEGTAAQGDDVQEGGPEERGGETPGEAAVPEWQEGESGEVADGDQ